MDISSEQLEAFVRNSNLIEGEFATKGLYFDVPLQITSEVFMSPQTYLSDIRKIHMLFAPVLDTGVMPGIYRGDVAYVGGKILPHRKHLSNLMDVLNLEIVQRIDLIPRMTTDARTATAWEIHNEFLCIHPFMDGNGRVARLMLNAYRLCCSLPLLTVEYTARSEYFRRIQFYEENIFKPSHPEVYSAE